MLCDAEALKIYFSNDYDIQLMGRGGDSFSVGLIYAMGTGMGCQNAIEFTTVARCLK